MASQGLRQSPGGGGDSRQVIAGKRMGTRSLHCKEVNAASKQSLQATVSPGASRRNILLTP